MNVLEERDCRDCPELNNGYCSKYRERVTSLIKNTIPEITEDLGRYWVQPNVSDIAIDDKYAVMEKASFNKLIEYNLSNPTGSYPGKMWKRKNDGVWYLYWYSNSERGKTYCLVNSREIIIV